MITIFEMKSSYSLEETITRVKDELANRGFGVLWELNFKDKFKEKGFDYDYNYWVFEVCNPKIALGVVSTNQNAGYFLPCKVAVFESEDGVKAGFARPSHLISLIDDSSEMGEEAKKVEQILSDAVRAAVSD